MDTTAKPQYDRVLHAFFDAMLVRAFVVTCVMATNLYPVAAANGGAE